MEFFYHQLEDDERFKFIHVFLDDEVEEEETSESSSSNSDKAIKEIKYPKDPIFNRQGCIKDLYKGSMLTCFEREDKPPPKTAFKKKSWWRKQ